VARRGRSPTRLRALVGVPVRLPGVVLPGVVLLGLVLLPVLALVLGLGAGRASAAVWVAPLPGPLAVGRSYDPPTSSYGAGHRGVDLRGASGQAVRSAGSGRVSYAGLLAGRGVVVVLHDGGLRTTYEPVSAAVRVGQRVLAGAPLGTLATGHAGCPGTCLHWGLLRGQAYLDPMSLLGHVGVRLLPADGAGGTGAVAAAPPPGPLAASRVATPAPVPAQQALRVRPAVAPTFALRSADRPWGLAALIALVVGLVLLVLPPSALGRPAARPRLPPPPGAPPSPGPPRTPAPTGRALRLPKGAAADAAAPVDLSRERLRRRAG